MKIKDVLKFVRHVAAVAKEGGDWGGLVAELWGVLSAVAEGELTAGRGGAIVEAVRAFYEANREKVDDLIRRAKEQAGEAVEAVVGKEKWGGRDAALKCRFASCWDGKNAEKRMMNSLSPSMSEEKFESYLAWMQSRGADCAHFLLLNKADGENAGYSIFGTGGKGQVNSVVAELWRARLQKIKKAGLAVALWLSADDSADWARDMLANARAYVDALKQAGILSFADMAVLGLEMDEYGTRAGWESLAAALRAVAPGLYIATHNSGGKYTFADLGEGVMGQLLPGANKADVQGMVAKIRGMGKDAWAFELARSPDRERAQWGLDAGAVGVGNW